MGIRPSWCWEVAMGRPVQACCLPALERRGFFARFDLALTLPAPQPHHALCRQDRTDCVSEEGRGLASRLVYVVEEAFASATIDSGHLPAQDVDAGFAVKIDANEAIRIDAAEIAEQVRVGVRAGPEKVCAAFERAELCVLPAAAGLIEPDLNSAGDGGDIHWVTTAGFERRRGTNESGEDEREKDTIRFQWLAGWGFD